MKKIFVLSICLLLLALFVASPVLAASKKKLTYWHPWGGRWGEKHVAIVDEGFIKNNPDIDLNVLFVPFAEIRNKVALGVISRTAPDVYTVYGPPDGYTFPDRFTPLNDLIAADPDISLDDYYPNTIQFNSWKGKIYGLPLVSSARALFYNKDVFREVGLDPNKPPVTWDEMDAYTEKINKVDNLGRFERIGFIPFDEGAGNWAVASYFWENGGKLYNPITTTVTTAHPKNVEALEWMVSYAEKYGVQNIKGFQEGWGNEVAHPFITGQQAMRMDGIWQIGFFKDYSPDLGFDLAPRPIPRGGVHADFVYTDSTFIPLGTKDVETAWRFVRWQNLDQAWMLTTLDLPSRYDHIDHPDLQGNKLYLKGASYGNYNRVIIDMPVLEFYKDKIINAVDEAVFSKLTPKAALEKAQRLIQAEVDRVLR